MSSLLETRSVLSNVLSVVFDIGTSPNALAEADAVLNDLSALGFEVARPDEAMLRREALDQAIRRGSPGEDETRTTNRAERFASYLRGDPKPEAEPFVMRPAPKTLHRALDRTWDSMREDSSGLKALEGEDGDEEVLELLRQVTDDDLRRASFVTSILRALAQSVRADRDAASQHAADRSS